MLKTIFWLSAVLALVSFTGAACGSGSSSDKDKDKTSGKQMTAQEKQALTEVKGALTNFANVKSFKVVLVAQVLQPSGMITSSTFTYDFVPPDRYQLYTGPTAGITRVVGSETFTYDRPSDRWMLLTDYSGPAYQGFNKLFDAKTMAAIAESLGDSATVTKASTDTVEGKICQLYVLTDEPTQNKTDLCIADNLPLRFVYHVGSLTTTAVFSAYNTNIEIERPKTN